MGIFEEAAIFRGVTKEDARQMLNCLNPVEKTYKKDDIIYNAGDEVTSMGVVLSGSVFIENDDIWGNHSILDRAGRGEIFAESANLFCLSLPDKTAFSINIYSIRFLNSIVSSLYKNRRTRFFKVVHDLNNPVLRLISYDFLFPDITSHLSDSASIL